MFVPERERQREAKLQQNRQYYEDLRQQIENKNKNKFSNFQNSQNPQNQQISLNPARMQSISQQNRIQFENGNFQNFTQSRGNDAFHPSYPSAFSQASSTLNREPLPNFSTTTVAPLNIKLFDYSEDNETLSSLPRQLNRRNGNDEASFSDRVKQIERDMKDIDSENKQNEEQSIRIESKVLPDIQRFINEIDNELEKTVSAKIPKQVEPVKELTVHNKEVLNALTTKFESIVETSDESLTSKKESFSKFIIKLQEIRDAAKRGLMEARSDAKRLKHCIDLDLQRLSEMEAVDASNIETIAKYNTIFERLDSQATTMYNDMTKDVTNATATSQKQISDEIKRLGDARIRAAGVLHDQAELINSRAAEGIKINQENITNIVSDFQTLTNDLSQNIASSIQETQNQADDMDNVISDKIDALINDADESFESLKSEVISTIKRIGSNVSIERDAIMSVIEKEGENREKNQNIIKEKMQSFTKTVEKEEKTQMENAKSKVEKMEKAGNDRMRDLLSPINLDVSYIMQKKVEMDRVENLVEGLENSISIARQQAFDSVGSLQANLEHVNDTLIQTQDVFKARVDEIEEALTTIENIDKSQMLKKEDIIRISNEINEDIDQRIHFIEHQLNVALSNIGEIDNKFTGETKTHGFMPATAALQLLAETTEKPQTDVIITKEPNNDISSQIKKILHEDEIVDDQKEEENKESKEAEEEEESKEIPQNEEEDKETNDSPTKEKESLNEENSDESAKNKEEDSNVETNASKEETKEIDFSDDFVSENSRKNTERNNEPTKGENETPPLDVNSAEEEASASFSQPTENQGEEGEVSKKKKRRHHHRKKQKDEEKE